MTIFVTGGAGFIGSNFILHWLAVSTDVIVNIDILTYAGNMQNLSEVINNPRHVFVRGNIADVDLMGALFAQYRPSAVVHFAAESHVDRSIKDPGVFVQTNVVGTFNLLQATYAYWESLSDEKKEAFRFLHISTDEVYGTLSYDATAFSESHPYAPNSPYAASKAASDHFVRAYHHTYGLPVLTTHCSNNYGPYQFPEKLIPLMISQALTGKDLPIYGDGQQIRDWLHVADHCRALQCVLERGIVGEVYNIGGWNEHTNIDIVKRICGVLDTLQPRSDGQSYSSQIVFVTDRPGHDRRYAINAEKMEKLLQWKPIETFDTGLQKTIQWYLDHPEWVKQVQSGAYRAWIQKEYSSHVAIAEK